VTEEGPGEAAPPPRRKLWLCADDYGISPAVSRAIRDLIGRGRLNATSVMVTAPSFSAAEARALADVAGRDRRAAIGLHFTLTAGWSGRRVPEPGPHLRHGTAPAA
jgi:chitin disaccharide deacetylase